jgi:phage-related protein
MSSYLFKSSKEWKPPTVISKLSRVSSNSSYSSSIYFTKVSFYFSKVYD